MALNDLWRYGSIGVGLRVSAGRALGNLMRKTTNQGTIDTWKPNSQGMVNFNVPFLSDNARKTQLAKTGGNTQYGPSRVAGPEKPPVTRRSSGPRTVATEVPSVEKTTEPGLTKEQQLQIDADALGLTGAERQAFIEEKRGIRPKIRSSKKYSAITEAEKSAGVATSTPADAGADEVSKEIESRIAELTASSKSYEEQARGGENLLGLEGPTDADYKALYDAQLAGDDEKYNTLLDVIKSKYETAKENQRQLGGVQTGQTAQFLARSGAFSSAGGQSMVANQQTANLERIQTLETEEANALAEAANAKRDGDLARLESYLQKADQLREERNNIQLKNVEYGQQLDEAAKAKATEQASYIGNLTLDQFNQQDPAYIAQVEQQLGMPPNYLRSLAETQDAISKAQSEQAAMEQSMKLFDLAKELPSGMSYQFADGTTIQGFNEPEGKVMQVTTATGDVAFVTIDPATGEVLKNVQLPGLISEIKASRMFGGGGGGGSSRNGTVLPSYLDGDDKLVLQTLQSSVGMTVEEAYARINAILGTNLEATSDMAGQKFTSDYAYFEALNLSDNLALDPASTMSALSGEMKFREVNVNGEKMTAIYDENNLNNWEWFNTAPETGKSSGGGIIDWFSGLWGAANEDVK